MMTFRTSEMVTNRHLRKFIILLALASISLTYFFVTGSIAEKADRDVIKSDLDFVKSKIAQGEVGEGDTANITYLYSPGNVTLVIPNASAEVIKEVGKLSSLN